MANKYLVGTSPGRTITNGTPFAKSVDVAYYLCPVTGAGTSFTAPKGPSLNSVISPLGGHWALCCTDGSWSVIKASRKRRDGKEAATLHNQIVSTPQATFLGLTFGEAKAQVAILQPSLLASMRDAYVPG